MKRTLLLSLVLCSLLATGCCKKCDLTFEEAELVHLRYEFDGVKTFSNAAGNEVEMSYGGREVGDSGKTCGGFGSPDLDACSTTATQQLNVSGGIANVTVILDKFKDDTSGSSLQMVVELGLANVYVFFDGNAINQSTMNRTESMTINGTTYDDVLTYFFDPNTDCKQPNSSNCVNNDDIVGLDFSLSAGVLRFQIHKGLQTPNEVYTLVN